MEQNLVRVQCERFSKSQPKSKIMRKIELESPFTQKNHLSLLNICFEKIEIFKIIWNKT